MFLFCSLHRIGTHGLGLGHQTEKRSPQRNRSGPFRTCWSFPAKPRFRACRARFTSPCCACSGPPNSAVRRLIVIAARGLVVKLAPSRPMPRKLRRPPKSAGNRPPAFRLCDTRKDFPESREPRVRYAKHPPRILFFGLIPGSTTCGPGPWPFRRRPPMARSARRASTAGSRPSRLPSTICPARPNASPAGGKGARPCRGPGVQVAAPPRPAARPPQAPYPRDRRHPRRLPLARLGRNAN